MSFNNHIAGAHTVVNKVSRKMGVRRRLRISLAATKHLHKTMVLLIFDYSVMWLSRV